MNGIELDRDELAALVLLLSASRVFGVADVVPADPAAREAAFAAGLEKLRARGYVKSQEPGQVAPDTGLLRLVSVLVDPRVVIVAERASGGDAALHFADDDGFVSLEGDAASGYRIGWVDDADLLARRVLRFFEIEPGIESHGAVVKMPEAAFSSAREVARSADLAAVEGALVAGGVLRPTAAEVAPMIQTGGHVLVIRLNSGQAEAARRAWVLGSRSATSGWIGWRESVEDTDLRLDPLSARRLAEVLTHFVEFLSPAPA